ncbi:hypothetical protein GCM10027436_13010 [Actinophytocola sediminis]
MDSIVGSSAVSCGMVRKYSVMAVILRWKGRCCPVTTASNDGAASRHLIDKNFPHWLEHEW